MKATWFYAVLGLPAIACLALANAAGNAPAGTGVIDLGGAWEFTLAPGSVLSEIKSPIGEKVLASFKPETGEESLWLPATVPGCAHTDLLQAGVVPDPFYGQNEVQFRELENLNWTYRKTFTVTPELLQLPQIDLICEGLDTLATIRLNQLPVAVTDNMYRRWVFPVRNLLREGENRLEITFTSPLLSLGSTLEQRLSGPMSAANDKIGGSPVFRKAPYQFGWDWGPRLVSCGIWRPIRLVAGAGPRLEFVTTRQNHRFAGVKHTRIVDMEVTVEVKSPVTVNATLQVIVNGTRSAKPMEIPAGLSRQSINCPVSNPELWWPSGLGRQKLYDLTVTLTPDGLPGETVTKKIGFRTIRLETKRNPQNEYSFTFIVNDRPVFAKGANWIPCDSFPSRVTPETYRRRLTDAVNCNMNMIRVWGGGIYEADLFYDLCDELGLMVWQDFMFSCSVYPGDESFLASVRAEAEDNIKRLANHPSLALWCGNNECETALKQWFNQVPSQWRHYEALFHKLLPDLCRELDPDRDYWPASPHSIGSDDPAKTTDGDCHIWTIWHGSQPFENFYSVNARFVSEFGFQSFPSLPTILAYTQPDNLNLTAPDIMFHQKNDGGNQRILTQMMDRFRMPAGFANFVLLSQLQQGLAMKMAVENWRRQMPQCMGTLYWQLNDCWPVTSWSSLDYFGRWKALQYFARRFYEPFHVSTSGGDWRSPVSIWVTNDEILENTIDVSWTLKSYSGETISSGKGNLPGGLPGSAAIKDWAVESFLVEPIRQSEEKPWTPLNTYLSVQASCGPLVSRNIHHFARFKDLELPRAKLRVTTHEVPAGLEVTVSTDSFAKWVSLEADGDQGQGRFADNYFDLEPGETRTVLFSPMKKVRITARSLVNLAGP